MHLLILFTATFVIVATEHFSYERYRVYQVNPKNQTQIYLLRKLNENSHIDFWSALRFAKPADVMVHPKAQKMFTWMLTLYKIPYKILIDNLETVLQNERHTHNLTPMPKKGKISFTRYNRFHQINAYLDKLARCYPKKVTVKSIGKSYARRNLKVIQISSNSSASKPIIFIDGGIHAREWISPATVQYIINQLVENSTNSYLLDKVDWHILPVMNPDGYEYTHTNNRFWRKTRSPQQGCIGTDPNRNFGFHWGEIGASSDPCDETYMGPSPFSEIETQNTKIYIEGLKNRIKLYLTFHSYGNYLLYPWGYTSELPVDDAKLRSLAEQVNEAIMQAGGDPYTIGSSTNVLYAAAGGSDDWAKGVAGIQLSYTIELPGGGSSGFDPPPSDILPIAQETFPGIKVYGEYIAQNFG